MSTLSVIICTFNREQSLRQTIDDVLRQDRSAEEIIVVDQTERHEPATDRLLASPQLKVVKLTEANLPAARNVGISHASGDIVLFVDDDICLKSDFLRRLDSEFEGGGVDGVAPLVLSESVVGLDGFDRQPSSLQSGDERRKVRAVIGACMAFRRQAILDVGGFDPFLGILNRSASGEDIEFSRRFSGRGYGLWLNPDLMVLHRDFTPGGCGVRIGSEVGATIHNQRALAYIVLKEENSLLVRTPRAYARLLRTFLFRRDRIAPRSWLPAIREMNLVMRELRQSLGQISASGLKP